MSVDNPCTVQAPRPRFGVFAAVLAVGIGIGTGIGMTVANAEPTSAPRSSPAAPSNATKSAPQTVTWYANNPTARSQVVLACLDDPGRLRKDPDCINAQQASVTIALREARSRTGSLNPATTGFWANDPEARANKILVCKRNPQLQYCGVALRSLQIEAKAARR